MTLRPANLDDLRAMVAKANATGGRVSAVDLGVLANIREHTPEDMTVTVEAGMTLAALQAHLATAAQWLPIDPPNPGSVTVGGLLDENLSGSRCFGYGTIREHLIGIGVVLADGRLIHAGGKVVKNVAGYDLCKLFVGARGTLGVIVEATFKLRPLPEAEVFVQTECASLDEAARRIELVLNSPLTPVSLDLKRDGWGILTLVVGFAGSREEVEWQHTRAVESGIAERSSLMHAASILSGTGAVRKLSVAPSKLIETIIGLGGVPFFARAGNGVIYYRAGDEKPKPLLPRELLRRVKEAYDPKRVFPDWSL